MITAARFHDIVIALPGVVAAPHVDRVAYRVVRIMVTLAPDGLSANFMLSPMEQETLIAIDPNVFAQLPNKWGNNGATSIDLTCATEDQLHFALSIAYPRAASKKPLPV